MSCKQTEFGLNHNNVGAQLVTIIGASTRVAQQLSITVNPGINSFDHLNKLANISYNA